MKLKISRSMDADVRFHQERMEYVICCFHEKHNIPPDSMTTNWTLKHISVQGQIVVKTCQSGTLTYIKYHDIEAEVEEQMEKMAINKLIATTVSSREIGLKRREEGKTMSSQRQTATQGIQQTNRNTSEGGGRDKLENVDGDFPACMRVIKESIEDNAKKQKTKNESLKRRVGGRLKYSNVDGDMPLCLRKTVRKRKGGSSSNESEKDNKSRMMSGSRDLCGVTARKRNNKKATNNDVTFIVLQKSERIEEMVCELGAYRWDALLLCETWRHDKEEIWETHHKHFFLGAGEYDNKHGVGILLNMKWK